MTKILSGPEALALNIKLALRAFKPLSADELARRYRREKIDAAFQRKFGPGVTLATEAAEWQRERFERVHARMTAMPSLTADVAALITKGRNRRGRADVG